MREWFGARRLFLKTQYTVERARERMRAALNLTPATVQLENVQRRLEIVLSAVYGRHIPIAPIERNVWNRERVRQFAKGDIRGTEATPLVDGETIFLPPELNTRGGKKATIERYRLFALEQAERIARGTAALAPLDDPLERDLYLMREGAAIDAEIAQKHPGVVGVLSKERREVLAKRPKIEDLTPAEREVEQMIRAALAEDVASNSAANAPEASREWAIETAKQIRARSEKYRGLPPAAIWGTIRKSTNELPPRPDEEVHWQMRGQFDTAEQQTEKGEQSQREGEAEREKDEDRPSDGEQSTPEEQKEISQAADRTPAQTDGLHLDGKSDDPSALEGLPRAIAYDEWNSYGGAYIKRGAAVRLYPAELGDAAWARDALRNHGATVRQIRQQFERLRARRTLLSRQLSGDELDIAACVDAIVDRKLGNSPDERLYLDARPARRGLAIAIVVDTSGSTEVRVNEEYRIVDLEKIALLLASQALDALGDLYAVYAFAGKTAQNVKLTVIKDFGERNGETVDRRIAALKPSGYTRMGAAIRHATTQLARQSAGHRLLLLLSDGRPNDIDIYQGPYGVEDSRQAIFEARASGVYPFCLTIDANASEYLPRIFGQAGHTILQRPHQLPTALLGVVRTLIKR